MCGDPLYMLLFLVVYPGYKVAERGTRLPRNICTHVQPLVWSSAMVAGRHLVTWMEANKSEILIKVVP
jgi:hypothetical protein